MTPERKAELRKIANTEVWNRADVVTAAGALTELLDEVNRLEAHAHHWTDSDFRKMEAAWLAGEKQVDVLDRLVRRQWTRLEGRRSQVLYDIPDDERRELERVLEGGK